MKKSYVKPALMVEVFTPNEYVAACGDGETTYKFVCNAPGGPLYYYKKLPAQGNQPSVGSSGTLLGSYSPCQRSHSVTVKTGESVTLPFYWGYVDKTHGSGWNVERRNEKLDSDELVIVWRGENNNNGHATANLNISSWETEKS